jgi:hypothetical protein
MKVIAESGATHDIGIDADGLLAVSEGKQAEAEIVGCVLRTLLGEIQLNPSLGIDYLGTVFKSVGRTGIWKHFASQAVESLPFVKSIVSFDAVWKPSTKTMDFEMVTETDEGEVETRS